MSGHFGIPGIGGSLGKCAVCGDPFLREVLTGETIQTLKVDGIAQTLYSHDKCLKTLERCLGEKWRDLPEASPIRQAFAKANGAREEREEMEIATCEGTAMTRKRKRLRSCAERYRR